MQRRSSSESTGSLVKDTATSGRRRSSVDSTPSAGDDALPTAARRRSSLESSESQRDAPTHQSSIDSAASVKEESVASTASSECWGADMPTADAFVALAADLLALVAQPTTVVRPARDSAAAPEAGWVHADGFAPCDFTLGLVHLSRSYADFPALSRAERTRLLFGAEPVIP